VIADKFQQQTLALMTGLKFPTAAEKQQAQMLMQQIQRNSKCATTDTAATAATTRRADAGSSTPHRRSAAAATLASRCSAATGLEARRGEHIAGHAFRPATRRKVDVETDSTIASSLSEDMKGLEELLTALVSWINGTGGCASEALFRWRR
jgi:hypothetical protein